MKKASKVIKATKKLIKKPCDWRQGAKRAGTDGPMCLVQAMATITGTHTSEKNHKVFMKAISYLHKASLENDCSCITQYNDTHTHEEVLKLCDRAIKLAKQNND